MPTTRGRVMPPKGKNAASSTPKTPQKQPPTKCSPRKKSSPTSTKKSAQTLPKGKAKAPVPAPEEQDDSRVAIMRSTIPENLEGWLPANYIQLIVASKTREEWQAKVKWLVAVLFFRCRFFAPATVRSILQILQPTDSQVLVATSADNVSYFKGLVLQLYDRIWQPHIELARLFLSETAAGIDYLKSYQKQSEGHRLRSKMTPESLELSLSLTASDVRGLWTAIEYTAHSECWTSSLASKGSRIYIEALRRASYGLMARMINHWLRRSKRHTDLSFDADLRVQDFQSVSDINNPPTWPKPPPRGERPSSLEEWVESYRDYPDALKNPLFNVLKDRISKENANCQMQDMATSDQPEAMDINDESSSDTDDSLTDLDSDEFKSDHADEFPDHNSTIVDSPEQHDSGGRQSGTIKATARGSELDLDSSPNARNRSRASRHMERDTTPSPVFPAHNHKPFKISIPHRPLAITAGPTPLFQSTLNQPEELEGRNLPEASLNKVTKASEVDREGRRDFINYLRDECMDDEWYESSEVAYVTSLSSIGKAEYAMQCLNRDLERWSYAIWALNQKKLQDEKLMIDLEEKRQQAIQRQRLITDLEAAGVSTNEAAMQMLRSHRLREQHDADNRNRTNYTQAGRQSYSGSSTQRYTGISSSPILTTAPPSHHTISTQRLEAGSRRQGGVGISSSPLPSRYSQPQFSTPGSPLQSILGNELPEAHLASRNIYGPTSSTIDVAGEGYRGTYSHDSQLTGNSKSQLFLNPSISSGPTESSAHFEERRKRKLERRAKREAKRARISGGPTTTTVTIIDGLTPADDEYYAQPLQLREVARSHHDSDYTGVATSESITISHGGTPAISGISGLRGNGLLNQEISAQATLAAAPPPSSQSMTYGDFSSSFNPQVRQSAHSPQSSQSVQPAQYATSSPQRRATTTRNSPPPGPATGHENNSNVSAPGQLETPTPSYTGSGTC